MTPGDMYCAYRELQTTLINSTIVYDVDVHEYRNNALGGDFSTADGKAACAKLWEAIKKKGTKLGSGHYRVECEVPTADPSQINCVQDEIRLSDLNPCYQGKGTPAQISKALRLAHACGLISNSGIPAAMQRYVDDNIGLDCSGFVTNYLNAAGLTALPSMDTPSTSYRTRGTPRKTLDEITGGEVMAWADTNHVAVLDLTGLTKTLDAQNCVTSLTCNVAEATGAQSIKDDIHSDGLLYTRYTVLSVNKQNIFKVSRSTGWEKASAKWTDDKSRQNTTHNVHIRLV